VLTTPPFPYTREDIDEAVGMPVILTGEAEPLEDANIHYGEVGIASGRLVTAGKYGWTLVVTGTGPTIAESQRNAYALTGRVFVPNLRYRRDIGDALAARDFAQVAALGLFDE
jgi:phosphoribosylamine--glycine ligase